MTAYDPRNLDPDKTRPYSVSLPIGIDDELTRFAARAEITKSKLMANILGTAIDILDFGDKLFIVDIAVNLRDLIQRIKKKKKASKQAEGSSGGSRSISFTLPLKTYDKLEHYAKRADITPSMLAQNILSMGVEELQDGEKYGFLQAALLIEKFGVEFKDKFWRVLGFLRKRSDIINK